MARITHLNINHRGDDGFEMNADDIPFTPAGTISSTDVQAAIEEVAAEAGSGSGPFESIDTINWKWITPGTTIYDIGETALISWTANDLYAQGGDTASIDLADTVVIITGDDGLIIPTLSSEPSGGDGTIYYNTSTDKFRAYQNGAWVNIIGAAHTHVYSEVPSGTINGSNAAFTLAATPASGTLRLYKNGLRQRAGSGNDYTLSTNTITYEAGNVPQTGDSHVADYES